MDTTKELVWRLGSFAAIFAVMAAFEVIVPRRKLSQKKAVRWKVNLGMTLLNSVLVRLLAGGWLVSIAWWCQEKNFGLVAFFPQLPEVAKLSLGLLILDCAIYWQHLIFHKIPFFWNFHKVHHIDLDLDVTSGLRFHPVEIGMSLLLKALLVYLFGVTPVTVIVFEIVLNGASLFNHSNVYISEKIDIWLRKVIVTPDMHRIHHSQLKFETDSNYGFSISLWDHLFRTHVAKPKGGQKKFAIGQKNYSQLTGLVETLAIPFKKPDVAAQ